MTSIKCAGLQRVSFADGALREGVGCFDPKDEMGRSGHQERRVFLLFAIHNDREAWTDRLPAGTLPENQNQNFTLFA